MTMLIIGVGSRPMHKGGRQKDDHWSLISEVFSCRWRWWLTDDADPYDADADMGDHWSVRYLAAERSDGTDDWTCWCWCSCSWWCWWCWWWCWYLDLAAGMIPNWRRGRHKRDSKEEGTRVISEVFSGLLWDPPMTLRLSYVIWWSSSYQTKGISISYEDHHNIISYDDHHNIILYDDHHIILMLMILVFIGIYEEVTFGFLPFLLGQDTWFTAVGRFWRTTSQKWFAVLDWFQ